MSDLLNNVTALLDAAELKYELRCDDNRELIDLGRMSNNPPYSLQIYVSEENSLVNMIAGAECYMPENKREAACVLLNKSNFEYMHKSYIDPNDGQLMSQRCLDVDGGALNKDVLFAAMGSIYAALKNNYDALMRMRYAGNLPDKIEE